MKSAVITPTPTSGCTNTTAAMPNATHAAATRNSLPRKIPATPIAPIIGRASAMATPTPAGMPRADRLSGALAMSIDWVPTASCGRLEHLFEEGGDIVASAVQDRADQ